MPKQIKSIGTPLYHPDQALITAPLEFTDGTGIEIIIPVAEVGRFVAYFAKLNDFLSQEGVCPQRGPTDDLFGTIKVHGLGFQAETDQTLLVLDLAGCRLGFALENTQLKRLSREISQVALALSADNKTTQ